MTNTTNTLNLDISILKQIGNEWVKFDKHRIYFDTIEFYGLDIVRYNTGNISSASLDGETVSNSYARQTIASMEKFYFDVKENRFETGNQSNSRSEKMKANLMKRYDELTAEKK